MAHLFLTRSGQNTDSLHHESCLPHQQVLVSRADWLADLIFTFSVFYVTYTHWMSRVSSHTDSLKGSSFKC